MAKGRGIDGKQHKCTDYEIKHAELRHPSTLVTQFSSLSGFSSRADSTGWEPRSELHITQPRIRWRGIVPIQPALYGYLEDKIFLCNTILVRFNKSVSKASRHLRFTVSVHPCHLLTEFLVMNSVSVQYDYRIDLAS